MNANEVSVVMGQSAVFSRLDETSGVVLELRRKRYYMLSETGVAIMEMLRGGGSITLRDIVDSLLDELDMDKDTLEREVGHYLRELERRRVIELHPSSIDRPAESDPADSAETAEFRIDTAELRRTYGDTRG